LSVTHFSFFFEGPGILDLADFNPEAADLDLRVTPPQELSARQAIRAIIAAPVHALTRAKRILQNARCVRSGS